MSATVLKKALYFLAQRDHSCAELYRKLEARHFAKPEIQQVIDYCCQQGWIDDARFSQCYIQQRSRKGYGPIRIQSELQHLGIDKTLTTTQLSVADVNWTALAQQVLERRFGHALTKYNFLKNKEIYYKALRFLQYRGFRQLEIRNIQTMESH